jgi:hypothetical protein
MAPKWAKQDLAGLKAALRVLREDDRTSFDEVIEEYAGVVAALLLEPRHAIQQRSAQAFYDEVEERVAAVWED